MEVVRSLFSGIRTDQGSFGFAEPQTLLEHLDSYKSDEGYEPVGLPKPTEHKPGTWAKVEDMRIRLENDLHLWHPEDAQDDCRQNVYGALVGASWEDLS